MKKNKRQYILAIFTFLALIILLAVEVNMLLKAALIEEKNFNRDVYKALQESRETIEKRASVCSDMQNYLCGKPCHERVIKEKIAEIDSILHYHLDKYNIDLEYTFAISDSISGVEKSKFFKTKCYLKSINGLLEKDGIHLKLRFPGRNQFILSQIKGTFLLAFTAVLFVMVSFIITFSMYRKERTMAQHTSDFINNMVHEFQTPLSNIHLATNLIKKRKTNDEKINEYLNIISSENHKLEKHVEEILKVSSPEGNQVELKQVDLHDVIQSTALEFQPRINEAGGKFKFNLDARSHFLKADPNHLKLIFSNLIDNAIKYADSKPVVVFSSMNKASTIEISVKDNGIGIDKNHLNLIFEKYYRVPTGDVHNVKGFGLGLTFVKKMVEKYGGRIMAASSKGSGTIFTISLPLTHETHKNTAGRR
ncbi:MAG: HAMP domain-containing histidine kinase [Prolixibacteraceae bacterium]|nr:HAMP domain-containing histidine kinase [Prolixibacteraceae bacterium]